MTSEKGEMLKAEKGETFKGERVVVVDFLNLNTKYITFGDFKLDKYKNKVVPIKYKGRDLYVRFPHRTLPFGINIKTAMVATEGKGKSDEASGKDEDATGYDVAWSLNKDYSEEGSDDYAFYRKAQEIDNFFIEAAVANPKWIDEEKPKNEEDVKFLRRSIAGRDEYLTGGKLKSLLKWSRDKEKNVNLTYPPRINSTFDVVFSQTERNPENNRKKCTFKTKFFDESNNEITPINESNYDTIVPKFSKFSKLCKWGYLTTCSKWITMKSSIAQCSVIPREDLSLDENYLAVTDECDATYLEESAFEAPPAAKASKMKLKTSIATFEEDGEDIIE